MSQTLGDIDFSHFSAAEKMAFAHQLLGDAMMELQGSSFTAEQIASFQADVDAYRAGALSAESWDSIYNRLVLRTK